MRWVFACGGEFAADKFVLERGDVLVAVDSGYDKVKDLAEVKYAVGDFDSLGYVPEGVKVIRHPSVKDYTDTQLALEFAESKGAKNCVIYGGLGGRLDHTLANLQTGYALAKRGVSVRFVGKDCEAFYITDKAVMQGEEGRYFSLFAFDKASGVSIDGAKYNLFSATLDNTFPLGVSNAFSGGECTVSVGNGALLAIIDDAGIE